MKPLYWLSVFGFDVPKLFRTIEMLPILIRDYYQIRAQNQALGSRYELRFAYAYLEERHAKSGIAGGHYFHQDLLVAKRILRAKPVRHVDVGSRVDGFVAHVATFRPIEVFDIRPLRYTVPNITFRRCDITNRNLGISAYCDSLSCLHALEHFGLGRYGDRIDIEGHLRGLENLHKILQPNGTLYLSVPIGPDRIEFNGHRVLSTRTVLELVKDRFALVQFSYVDDLGDLHENVRLDSRKIATNCGCEYGCGIFELRKL